METKAETIETFKNIKFGEVVSVKVLNTLDEEDLDEEKWVDAAYVGMSISENVVLVQLIEKDGTIEKHIRQVNPADVRLKTPHYVVLSDLDDCVTVRLELPAELGIKYGDFISVDDDYDSKWGFVMVVHEDPECSYVKNNAYRKIDLDKVRIIKSQLASSFIK